ncbi:aminotransferase class IV [Thalassotalea aquiviva]|uniref:aminotransferase class IV n=1 Tax=Thalassotalea aquiviva TaxID=3242415 RepID=UPI00352AEDD3
MNDIVFLNGEYIAKDNAKISVLDRGFLFADGVYEVIPIYNKCPFRLEQHLERLDYSLSRLEIKSPYTHNQWLEIITQVIAKNQGSNLSIYIHVTRGKGSSRNHVFDDAAAATVLVMANALNVAVKSIKTCKATLLEDIRWQFCDIKSIALLGNILLRNQAERDGFDEAILHRQQMVSEGSTTNVFMVKDGQIFTPIADRFILGGITRELIIELANELGLKVHQQACSVEQLLHADEVWISSSTREISPVIQIDDKMIAKGKIGPIAQALHLKFQQFKQTLIA